MPTSDVNSDSESSGSSQRDQSSASGPARIDRSSASGPARNVKQKKKSDKIKDRYVRINLHLVIVEEYATQLFSCQKTVTALNPSSHGTTLTVTCWKSWHHSDSYMLAAMAPQWQLRAGSHGITVTVTCWQPWHHSDSYMLAAMAPQWRLHPANIWQYLNVNTWHPHYSLYWGRVVLPGGGVQVKACNLGTWSSHGFCSVAFTV